VSATPAPVSARHNCEDWHTGLLSQFDPRRLPFYLAFACVVAVLCSNSLSNVLIAAAVLALGFCHFRFGHPVRFPPVALPLALFFLATVISVALSGHIREGWPGPRKFYLYFILLLVYSSFRSLREVRALIIACAGMMTLSALWSLHQFWDKLREARLFEMDFREYYTVERITGFTSHWMTLSGEEMFVLLLLCALLLFFARGRLAVALAAMAATIAIGFLAAYTRSMWMGAALGAGYLVWLRNKNWLLLAPLPVLLLLWLNPAGIGDRIVSSFRPAGDLDSNQFRVVCRRAGWEMIKAHPWFGLGPEQVKAQFLAYIPPDVPRPLPTGAYMHLHNVYLQYAAERGVPALLAFLWLLGVMLRDFIRAARAAAPDDRDRRCILYGAIAVMLAACSAGWYEHNLNDGEILTLFLAVCACGYLAADAQAARASAARA
jgi:putative inorganic carbon (hco3(-)) transporter